MPRILPGWSSPRISNGKITTPSLFTCTDLILRLISLLTLRITEENFGVAWSPIISRDGNRLSKLPKISLAGCQRK